MKGLVIASHGNMAQGMMNTIDLFFKNTKQLEALSLQADDNPDEFYEKISEAIKRNDSGDGVLVMVDIPGGTPCHMVAKTIVNGNVTVITGMNLTMVLEFLASREYSDVDVDALMESGKSSIVCLNSLMKEAING